MDDPCFPPFAPPFKGRNQNDLLAWMQDGHKQFGGVFRSKAYGASVYVTNELPCVEHVLRGNWQNYKKGWAIKRVGLLLGNGLMVSEGELWKRQRRMIQPVFQDRVIEALTATIAEANTALLRRWERAAQDAQAVNVTRDISVTVREVTLQVIFGNDYGDVAPQFGVLSEEQGRNLEFAQAFRSLGHLIVDVARRRGNEDGSPDMLGALMRARDKGTGEAMSDGQLIDEVLTLLVAGHETTASTLNWTWYLLSRNPQVERKLHAQVSDPTEPTYVRQVIEEAMRLYPAGWLLTRRAIRDDRLGDYHVPAGTEIYVSPYVIQRLPDLWRNPDEFDPDRFDSDRTAPALATLPFSAGPRNCIGEHLARLEMQVHVSMVARKLRLRYLGDEPELDLGVNLRSKEDLLMLPIPLDQCRGAPRRRAPAGLPRADGAPDR